MIEDQNFDREIVMTTLLCFWYQDPWGKFKVKKREDISMLIRKKVYFLYLQCKASDKPNKTDSFRSINGRFWCHPDVDFLWCYYIPKTAKKYRKEPKSTEKSRKATEKYHQRTEK